tara:strand:+ start:600 stop:2039 length:1440 start_codon:yes stop_codon:yes gene_type:complete
MKQTQTIVVDLDGTLTPTDTLYESIVLLIKNNPFIVFFLLSWLLKGIAYFKSKVAENCNLDMATLPYNLQLIEWLKEEKANGKKIVLCTAANERIASAVSEYLKIFDEVIASDISINLKSASKHEALENRFGNKGFDYAGNSKEDFDVWRSAHKAIVVNASKSFLKKVKAITVVSKIFPHQPIKPAHWRHMFRIHHWVKNLLLFVPLLAAHQFGDMQFFISLLIAFVSFSLCASAVYMVNDLLDLNNDRMHSRKRYRPFAAAVIPIKYGIVLIPIFIIMSFALAMVVGSNFFICLMSYFVLTILYSFYLKRFVLIDCLTLAGLYTIRIIAGNAAVTAPVSFWLLGFSAFIFLSLAFVKRYAELLSQEQEGHSESYGRGYILTDAKLLQTFGITAGYASVLVFALYVNSETVIKLYAQPELIWFAVPLVLFWINWIWIRAHRGEMYDDPIVFALKDRTSQLSAIFLICIFLFSAANFTIS